MTIMTNKQAAVAATTGQGGSWLQLFNPISQVTGGNDRYPEFVANMFPGNPRAAWMVSKLGAVGLLAAAMFGAARGVQHVVRTASRRGEEQDDPARKLKSQLGTTFSMPLSPRYSSQLKKAAEAPKQSLSMPEATDIIGNTVNTGLPALAFLLMAAGAYKGADVLADKRRNKLLDDDIARKSQAVRQLMQARARVAKGTATDAEVRAALEAGSRAGEYVKTASDPSPVWRAGITGAGLLLAALGISSAVGAYKYFSAADPDNIKYKALKKGLETYAKNKAAMTPITTIPEGAEEYFKAIDEGGARKGVREQPEVSPAARPISITL